MQKSLRFFGSLILVAFQATVVTAQVGPAGDGQIPDEVQLQQEIPDSLSPLIEFTCEGKTFNHMDAVTRLGGYISSDSSVTLIEFFVSGKSGFKSRRLEADPKYRPTGSRFQNYQKMALNQDGSETQFGEALSRFSEADKKRMILLFPKNLREQNRFVVYVRGAGSATDSLNCSVIH